MTQSVESTFTDNGIICSSDVPSFIPSFALCVQAMAEVTVPDLPPPPPQDASTDILPDGEFGGMNALGWTVKI